MEAFKKLLPPEVLPLLSEVLQSEAAMASIPAGITAKELFTAMAAKSDENLNIVNNNDILKDKDVVVCSYPKTGTNWTIEIIDRLIYQDLEVLEKWKSIPLPLKMFEMGSPKKFQIFDKLPFDRRVLGTHVKANRLDMSAFKKKKLKMVYVLRNPKDTLVSMFNFLKKLPPFKQEPMISMVNQGFSVFYDHYMNGDIPIDGESKSNYLNHIQAFLKIREEMGIYFIYYEDLKKDFNGQVRKLAEFLEVPLSDDKLAEISGKCTIDAMQKSYSARAGFQAAHATAFINKGGVGGWKNYFTVAQSECWDEMVKKELSSTDINFTYTI